jgi:hypothetical protein
MNICYGTTTWAMFFTIFEIFISICVGFYYTRSIYFIFKNEQSYRFEFLDWIIIIISQIQIFLTFISILIGYYFGLTVLLEILKFSQNFIIGGILLYQILIWHKYTITQEIVKYFMITLFLIVALTFIWTFIFEYSFLSIEKCKSNAVILIIFISLISNILIILFAIYKNLEETNDETKSLTKLVEDQHNLNDLIQKFASNIKKMKKYYLIITVLFTLSFFVDVYYKLIMTGKVITTNSLNESHKDNFSACIYYGDYSNNLGFKEFLICSISFLFRDIGPHVYIYLALFYYKPNINSRSSSFIELI